MQTAHYYVSTESRALTPFSDLEGAKAFALGVIAGGRTLRVEFGRCISVDNEIVPGSREPIGCYTAQKLPGPRAPSSEVVDSFTRDGVPFVTIRRPDEREAERAIVAGSSRLASETIAVQLARLAIAMGWQPDESKALWSNPSIGLHGVAWQHVIAGCLDQVIQNVES